MSVNQIDINAVNERTMLEIAKEQLNSNKEVFQSLKDHDEGKKVIATDNVKKGYDTYSHNVSIILGFVLAETLLIIMYFVMY